jgi:HSP20 family protein
MPRRDIDRLQGEIEELFADLWQVPRFSGLRSGFRPSVDCYTTEDPPQLVLVACLPGVDPASLELTVGARELTLAGTRQRPRVPGQVYQQAEIEYGPFERHVALEHAVDADAAEASYEAGMLTVTLPFARRSRRGTPIAIAVRRSS